MPCPPLLSTIQITGMSLSTAVWISIPFMAKAPSPPITVAAHHAEVTPPRDPDGTSLLAGAKGAAHVPFTEAVTVDLDPAPVDGLADPQISGAHVVAPRQSAGTPEVRDREALR